MLNTVLSDRREFSFYQPFLLFIVMLFSISTSAFALGEDNLDLQKNLNRQTEEIESLQEKQNSSDFETRPLEIISGVEKQELEFRGAFVDGVGKENIVVGVFPKKGDVKSVIDAQDNNYEIDITPAEVNIKKSDSLGTQENESFNTGVANDTFSEQVDEAEKGLSNEKEDGFEGVDGDADKKNEGKDEEFLKVDREKEEASSNQGRDEACNTNYCNPGKDCIETAVNATTKYYGFSESNNFFKASLSSMGKEGGKKSLSKALKSSAFVKKSKSAYYASETGKFISKSVFDSARNFPDVIEARYPNGFDKSKKTPEDYIAEGKIIRQSLLAHLPLGGVQSVINSYISAVFSYLGESQEVTSFVNSYMNPNGIPSLVKGEFAVMEELSGDTAEKLLLLEHPELTWLPDISKAGLSWLCFLAAPMGHFSGLGKFRLCEGVTANIVGGSILAMLKFDSSYDKYKILDAYDGEGKFQLANFDQLGNLYRAGAGVALNGFLVTGSEVIKYGTDLGMLVDNDVKTLRSEMKTNTERLGYAIDVPSIVNAKLHKEAERELAGTGESKATGGVLVNILLSVPYLYFIVNPSSITNAQSPALIAIVRLDLANKFIMNTNRVYKQMQEVNNREKSALETYFESFIVAGLPLSVSIMKFLVVKSGREVGANLNAGIQMLVIVPNVAYSFYTSIPALKDGASFALDGMSYCVSNPGECSSSVGGLFSELLELASSATYNVLKYYFSLDNTSDNSIGDLKNSYLDCCVF